MALDEAIFREMQRCPDAGATLRLYGWVRPIVSCGRFQDVAYQLDSEECRRRGVDIVRRPTGGKAVLHRHDVTYAVIARENGAPFRGDILGTYRLIGACLVRGLARLGIEATMAPVQRLRPPAATAAACFSVSSAYELLAGGRKVCGSAQLRAGGAFLQHGSLLRELDADATCALLLPSGGDRATELDRLTEAATSLSELSGRQIPVPELCRALEVGFAEELGVRLVRGEPTPTEERRRDVLQRGKYSSLQWNRDGRWREG